MTTIPAHSLPSVLRWLSRTHHCTLGYAAAATRMKLLGDVNWYLPRWLGWLPEVKVEGAEPAPEALEPVAT